MRANSIAVTIAMIVLAGCEAAQHAAPRTAAGFQAAGVAGALDGASDAVLSGCGTLDELRPVLDGLAAVTGTAGVVGGMRAARQGACAVAAAVQAAGGPIEASVSVHRQ